MISTKVGNYHFKLSKSKLVILTQPLLFYPSRWFGLCIQYTGSHWVRHHSCTSISVYSLRWNSLLYQVNVMRGIVFPGYRMLLPVAVWQVQTLQQLRFTLTVYVGCKVGVHLTQVLRMVPIFLSSPKDLKSDITIQWGHIYIHIYINYSLGPAANPPEFKDKINSWLAVWLLFSRK